MGYKTTIQLDSETREDLNAVGERGETYNDILKRLIKEHKELSRYRTVGTVK